MLRFLKGLVLLTVFVAMHSHVLAIDLDAVPIWNEEDAKVKCPKICSGLYWNGQWKVDANGAASFCGTTTGAFIPVGPIWDNADAGMKCALLLSRVTWDGTWKTAEQGEMSVCGCELPEPITHIIWFNGSPFVLRWFQENQYEFTPLGQPDLDTWHDMVTVIYYPGVENGEQLDAIAKKVLETYQKFGAMVLLTDSHQRTDAEYPEYFAAVVFPQQAFMEFSQTRILMENGVGISLVYSHRIYDENKGEKTKEWILNNGPNYENHLKTFSDIPSLHLLESTTGQSPQKN